MSMTKVYIILAVGLVLVIGGFLYFRLAARSPREEEGAPNDNVEVQPKGTDIR